MERDAFLLGKVIVESCKRRMVSYNHLMREDWLELRMEAYYDGKKPSEDGLKGLSYVF